MQIKLKVAFLNLKLPLKLRDVVVRLGVDLEVMTDWRKASIVVCRLPLKNHSLTSKLRSSKADQVFYAVVSPQALRQLWRPALQVRPLLGQPYEQIWPIGVWKEFFLQTILTHVRRRSERHRNKPVPKLLTESHRSMETLTQKASKTLHLTRTLYDTLSPLSPYSLPGVDLSLQFVPGRTGGSSYGEVFENKKGGELALVLLHTETHEIMAQHLAQFQAVGTSPSEPIPLDYVLHTLQRLREDPIATQTDMTLLHFSRRNLMLTWYSLHGFLPWVWTPQKWRSPFEPPHPDQNRDALHAPRLHGTITLQPGETLITVGPDPYGVCRPWDVAFYAGLLKDAQPHTFRDLHVELHSSVLERTSQRDCIFACLHVQPKLLRVTES